MEDSAQNPTQTTIPNSNESKSLTSLSDNIEQ
jgi:hypothetical protein